MSLDVFLLDGEDLLFTSEISHNYRHLAQEVNVYSPVWHPGTMGITKAGDLLPHLTTALVYLTENTTVFQEFYGVTVFVRFFDFIRSYRAACVEHPSATVEAYR